MASEGSAVLFNSTGAVGMRPEGMAEKPSNWDTESEFAGVPSRANSHYTYFLPVEPPITSCYNKRLHCVVLHEQWQ